MAKPRDDRQKGLLRPALEEIVDFSHPLVRLAREIELGVSRQPVCQRLHARCWPAAIADAPGGGAVHLEDGVFGRPVSLTEGEVLRFGLMVDVVCV